MKNTKTKKQKNNTSNKYGLFYFIKYTVFQSLVACSAVDEMRWSAIERSGHKWASAEKVVRGVGEVWGIPNEI